jgi:hypothetical protein
LRFLPPLLAEGFGRIDDLPVPPRLVGVVTRKNRTISPAARLFIQTAQDVTKPLASIKYPGATTR